MKSKDLGFFTRHVEKIVLGAGVLIFLVILLLYVVGNPYAAEVRGQKLGAAALEEQIKQTADQLNNRLTTYRAFPEKEVYPWGLNFKARLDDVASSVSELPASVGRLGLGSEANQPPGEIPRYDLPTPPVPTSIVVADGFGVFDPQAGLENLEPRRIEQIYNMIGMPAPGQPADFAYVSVQGEFDMDAWLARLESQTLRNPVPRAFWRGKQAVTAVYLQRQELDPATGEWLDPVVVSTIPTQLAYTPTFTRNYDDMEARAYIEFVKQNQERIARPQFIPVAPHSQQWLPPDRAANLTPEDHRELDRLNRTIARLEKNIANLQDNMRAVAQRDATAAQRQAARATRQPTGRTSRSMDDMAGMAEVPTRGTPRATPAAPVSRSQEQAEQLHRSMTELQEARTKLNELLGITTDISTGGMYGGFPGMTPDMMYEDMSMYEDPYGMGMYGMPGMYGMQDPYAMGAQAPGRAPARRGAAQAQPQPEVQPLSRVIQVWAHDLSVERGKTYRYRLVVSVMNPLFREARVEDEQKSENFNKISLGPSKEDLEAAPWTQPIRVPPAVDFFLISGTAAQQFATVEIWRYYDGKPRKSEFTVNPGDPIGGTASVDGKQIDMRVGAVMVDLVNQATRSGVGNSTKMLYTQPGSEQIMGRSLEDDRNSPQRLRLENERRIVETLTGGLASSASAAP